MIDLTRFCAKHDIRTYLNAPFQEAGNSFATNGVIAVMVEGGAQPDMKMVDEKMAGKIQALIAGTVEYSQVLTIKFPDEAAKPCRICDGAGHVIEEKCDECYGDGEFEHGSHTYTCKECQGEGCDLRPAKAGSDGAEECESCGGFGTESRFLDFEGDGGISYRFQEKYLRLALLLPDCRLLVTSDNQSPARLEFDGGRGLLMPCCF